MPSLARAPFLAAALLLVLVTPALAAPATASLQGSPPGPGAVHASPGATGTVAKLGWRRVAGVSGYRIWRSTRPNGGFEPIGSSSAPEFRDASGLPGRAYFYGVTALLPDGAESALSTPTPAVRATWNESPHSSSTSGDLCLTCHQLHDADTAADVLGSPGVGPAPGEVAICESCHDGQGARSNVKDGPVDSFALASGHRVEEVTRGGDLTNECSSCHSPHADPRERPGMYRKVIDGRKVAGGNSWCAACHDDGASWAKDYPAPSSPVRDASGYPTFGTYPGPSVYADPAKNAHSALPAGPDGPKGDCLLCHAAHRGPNAYDGLVATFRPTTTSTLASDQADGTYAALCLGCHGGQADWVSAGAGDIARYVTQPATATAYAGHRILTAGGTLPVGAPIPCYDCHNPHGSARGNAHEISDELGQGLTTDSAAGVRAFCLTCHSSADGLVWDSVEAAYVPAGTRQFEGLSRDGSGGNDLRLGSSSDAGHDAADGRSCYECHGNDYTGGAGNAHAPNAGKPAAAASAPPEAAPATVQGAREKTVTVIPDERRDVEAAQ